MVGLTGTKDVELGWRAAELPWALGFHLGHGARLFFGLAKLRRDVQTSIDFLWQ